MIEETRRWLRGLAAAVGCLAVLAAGTDAAGDVAARVTYVANEGFLLETGGRKILIDALFHGETINWCHVPGPDALARLRAAEAPFDGVDLVLITHRHTDHFRPELVRDHLAANPEVVVCGPPQAIGRLRELEDWRAAWEPRLRELPLDLHESAELEVSGIRIAAHRVRHCAYLEPDPETGGTRNRHENVENLAYLVEIDGFRALHLGDAFLDENLEYFERLFDDAVLDLLFFEGWNQTSLEFLAERGPRHVIAMHLPPDPEQIERIAAHVGSRVPGVVVLGEPMESIELDLR